MGKLNKLKVARVVEQAHLHLNLGQSEKARALLSEVVDAPTHRSPPLIAALADSLAALDRLDEAEGVLRAGMADFPDEPTLVARLGEVLVRADRVEDGLELMERSRGKLSRDAHFLTQLSHALLRVGRLDEAERALSSAAQHGGGLETRLVQAIARGKRGRYAEAEALARKVEEASKSPRLKVAAQSIRADSALFAGDAGSALSVWSALREAGQLVPEQLCHMAYAAQVAGEPALCDALIGERLAGTPSAEDLLLFAEIANLRGEPAVALERLDRAERAPGERHPTFEYELLANRGRAQRLTGQGAEARATLELAAALPAFVSARLGPRVRIELGRLCLDAGDPATARAHFEAALALEPKEPEALQGLSACGGQGGTAAQDDALAAAKAEAEALRRRFEAREGELEALRQELQRAKKDRRLAEARAQEAAAAAAKTLDEGADRVRAELQAREEDVEGKAKENVARALGTSAPRCPPAVSLLLQVAERTFQKALYTELPAAAVAVLYSGALERSLFVLFVERFDAWLGQRGLRERFLREATRERRGTRVEYFDHFVEAFDRDRAGRPRRWERWGGCWAAGASRTSTPSASSSPRPTRCRTRSSTSSRGSCSGARRSCATPPRTGATSSSATKS